MCSLLLFTLAFLIHQDKSQLLHRLCFSLYTVSGQLGNYFDHESFPTWLTVFATLKRQIHYHSWLHENHKLFFVIGSLRDYTIFNSNQTLFAWLTNTSNNISYFTTNGLLNPVMNLTTGQTKRFRYVSVSKCTIACWLAPMKITVCGKN